MVEVPFVSMMYASCLDHGSQTVVLGPSASVSPLPDVVLSVKIPYREQCCFHRVSVSIYPHTVYQPILG